MRKAGSMLGKGEGLEDEESWEWYLLWATLQNFMTMQVHLLKWCEYDNGFHKLLFAWLKIHIWHVTFGKHGGGESHRGGWGGEHVPLKLFCTSFMVCTIWLHLFNSAVCRLLYSQLSTSISKLEFFSLQHLVEWMHVFLLLT